MGFVSDNDGDYIFVIDWFSRAVSWLISTLDSFSTFVKLEHPVWRREESLQPVSSLPQTSAPKCEVCDSPLELATIVDWNYEGDWSFSTSLTLALLLLIFFYREVYHCDLPDLGCMKMIHTECGYGTEPSLWTNITEKTKNPDLSLALRHVNEVESVTSLTGYHLKSYIHIVLNSQIILYCSNFGLNPFPHVKFVVICLGLKTLALPCMS